MNTYTLAFILCIVTNWFITYIIFNYSHGMTVADWFSCLKMLRALSLRCRCCISTAIANKSSVNNLPCLFPTSKFLPPCSSNFNVQPRRHSWTQSLVNVSPAPFKPYLNLMRIDKPIGLMFYFFCILQSYVRFPYVKVHGYCTGPARGA